MTRIIKNNKSRFSLESIYGDCLERIGVYIPNRGYAVVDHMADPRPGDVVICTKHPGTQTVYAKQVKTIHDGTITVGTAYTDPSKDVTFEAAEILGVVKEVYDAVFRSRGYVWPRGLARQPR